MSDKTKVMSSVKTTGILNTDLSDEPDKFTDPNKAKRPNRDPWPKMMEELASVPIKSLVCTQSCPPISGTLISVSQWGTTFQGTRYANFVLKDASGQISGVIFRAHDTSFEQKFKIGAKLSVSNAVVKPVKPNYRDKSGSDYELTIPNTLKKITVEAPPVEKISQPTTSRVLKDEGRPQGRILIKDVVEKIEPRKLVDVIGVIIKIDEVKIFNRDWQKMITRDFRILDESETEIAVTIWNERAKNFRSPVGTVVAIYDVVVRFQTGVNIKSLTLQKNSRFVVNPPGDDAERLKIWYGEWTFGQGSRSLINSAGTSASGSSENNRNSCFAEKTTNNAETIKAISDDKGSFTNYCKVNVESRRTSESSIQAETINEFQDSSSESEGSSVFSDEAYDDPPFPVEFVTSGRTGFTKIVDINDGKVTGFVNVLGVITRQNGFHAPWFGYKKIKVELLDESRQSIWMIVRGSKARRIQNRENSIIAAKRVRIHPRKNRKVLVFVDKTSILTIEPRLNAAEALRKWFRSEARIRPTVSIARVVPIADLKDGQIASILGILTRINEAKTIEAKYVYDVARTVNIIDSSKKMIRLALWRELARDFAIPKNSVIYATNVKIYGAQNSRNISGALTPDSRVISNPRGFEEKIQRLKSWYVSYQNIRSSDLQ